MNLTIRQFFAYLLGLFVLASICLSFAQHSESSANFKKVGYPSFESPQANPIVIAGPFVAVANTAASTVDLINRSTNRLEQRINVGIDPVSLAVRPDGLELWVSNHISDSVSVIDLDSKKSTFLKIIATIQEFDSNGATKFDEPVGIAFASNQKAYVALSSENIIAVIDVKTRRITNRLKIKSQDPRAIRIRDDKLYVIPFESGNKTQLSCGKKSNIDGIITTCDMDASIATSATNIKVNNVLSLGIVTDVVKHPKNFDRDLYIFDTKNDRAINTIDTLGTLLYGLAIDSKGRVYIAQTDARNDINGKAGTKNHGLEELENRPYLNQITVWSPTNTSYRINLEPLPPQLPAKGQALSTPYAIEISQNDNIIVATAFGSDKVFTLDTVTGNILGQVSVGSGPRGLALEHQNGELVKTWVYNVIDNSVNLVDLKNPEKPVVIEKIDLEDPTHPAVKTGRKAFNSSSGSTSETFSCASCHPNGHTDHLLWVQDPPIVHGGKQRMPRLTQTLRGLRDTAPFHWDGTQADPYGGVNASVLRKRINPSPNTSSIDSVANTRVLIDSTLAGVMHTQGDDTVNDQEQIGKLSNSERQAMATYLLSIPYPTGPRRSYTNQMSSIAQRGFTLFHIEGDTNPTHDQPNVCGDCHRLPFYTSTNSTANGMDTPTWRGAQDLHNIFPQGRMNIIDFDVFRQIAEQGTPEKLLWQLSWSGSNGVRNRFDPVWDLVLEMSTGFSGAFARQFTLSKDSINDKYLADLTTALEQASDEGAVVLEGEGVLIHSDHAESIDLQFQMGFYRIKGSDRKFTKTELVSLAGQGKFVGTFTARHGINASVDHAQPAIWDLNPIESFFVRQAFPEISAKKPVIRISGRHFKDNAWVIVDGRKVDAIVKVNDYDMVEITLSKMPTAGKHFLQVQVPDGGFSNDYLFTVKN